MLVINVIKILDLFRLKDIYQAHAMEWMKERKKLQISLTWILLALVLVVWSKTKLLRNWF